MQTKVVVKSEDAEWLSNGVVAIDCTCGVRIAVYGEWQEYPTECYNCGRRYYWTPKVYMLVEEPEDVQP